MTPGTPHAPHPRSPPAPRPAPRPGLGLPRPTPAEARGAFGRARARPIQGPTSLLRSVPRSCLRPGCMGAYPFSGPPPSATRQQSYRVVLGTGLPSEPPAGPGRAVDAPPLTTSCPSFGGATPRVAEPWVADSAARHFHLARQSPGDGPSDATHSRERGRPSGRTRMSCAAGVEDRPWQVIPGREGTLRGRPASSSSFLMVIRSRMDRGGAAAAEGGVSAERR
jgi:hypothetical protein